MTAQTAVNKHQLSIDATFVPWSKSRNAAKNHRSLNWKVTLKQRDREILTTDYSAGIAHCPAYKLPTKAVGRGMTLMRYGLIRQETETGRRVLPGASFNYPKEPILPDTLDVIYSLLSDADAIDYANFEDWASCFGYDTNSREAERIYRQCLEFGLTLRAALGDAALTELREAFEDY